MQDLKPRRQAPRASLFVGLAILALTVSVLPASAAQGQSGVAAARNATARLHNLDAAKDAGYVALVADLDGITCIESPSGAGTMGEHYLNPSLVPELFSASAVPQIEATSPELLVFEPGPGSNGGQLVALEYLTLKAAWDANYSAPPSLFGRTFDVTLAGNRYGLPDFYSLHAWIWTPNPVNQFAPYNQNVHCP